MARSLPEWIGRTDDSPPPQRVQLRVYLRFGGICQICFAKEKILGPEFDHRIALINGGSNSESNLVPVHPRCHAAKTKVDVAEKAATYKTQAHHLGIRKSRNPMPGSKASPYKRKMNGTVIRRAG